MIPPVASKFVAGESIDSALDHVRSLNTDGIEGMVNLLGEHYGSRQPAEDDADEYVRLVERIATEDVDASVSMKPTQLGLDLSPQVFEDNLDRVLDAADDVFVWMDMEGPETVDATLEAYLERELEGFGVCMQANMRRTMEDFDSVSDHPGKIRLVKGAYSPPSDVAYTGREVEHAYRNLVDRAFEEGFRPTLAVGSHDRDVIDYADDVAEEADEEFEIQMLMGIREPLQLELAESHDVTQYVPYGGRWKSYFYRRIKENPSGAMLAARSLLGR